MFYGQPDILGSMFHVEWGRNMLDMDFAYLRSHCFALDCRKEETMQKDRVIFVSSFNHCEKFLHFVISIVTLQPAKYQHNLFDHWSLASSSKNCELSKEPFNCQLLHCFWKAWPEWDQSQVKNLWNIHHASWTIHQFYCISINIKIHTARLINLVHTI